VNRAVAFGAADARDRLLAMVDPRRTDTGLAVGHSVNALAASLFPARNLPGTFARAAR